MARLTGPWRRLLRFLLIAIFWQCCRKENLQECPGGHLSPGFKGIQFRPLCDGLGVAAIICKP